MKYLDYKIIDSSNETVKIKITEQVYRCKEAKSFCLFCSTNGLELDSGYGPVYTGISNTVWLRGTRSAMDNSLITMPRRIFDKFKMAVIEYNFYQHIKKASQEKNKQ